MNKRILTALFAVIILASCGSTKNAVSDLAINTPIATDINLNQVVNDQVPVTVNPGRFTVDIVTYRLPRVIQGTYAVSNFGSFVGDFKAYDYKGEEMPTAKVDDNSWTIANAKELDKIIYYVNDTFDIEKAGELPTPYSMAGTNIEPDNYVLNLHGFIGYFDSLKNNQYKLDVTGPAEFVRTSALQQTASKTSDDGKSITTSYFAPRYFDITDNPMMYGSLSVEEFKVGDINIVLSVYSPNKIHSASTLKDAMIKMMQAQKTYLGAINSTPRYDIYVYLARNDETSPQRFGALEHHTSTVVVMPEATPKDALEKQLIDIVSHEFFHIVTPLSVHSEDVHYFDYNAPTFSKHLWMYEGVTEYFATLFQIDQELVDEDEFYGKIMGKIQTSLGMNDAMSFTQMSEHILEEEYAPQYYNVYQKGALIGMCVDILMREESGGNRGLLSLMKELSNKYGKNKPFEDDKLIDEIVDMTYPSLRTFFDAHVTGNTPIDYSQFFKKVGLTIAESKIKANYLLLEGRPIVSGDGKKGTIFFTDAVTKNSFWEEQGVQANDVIKMVDGNEVTLQNANEIFQEVFGWEPGKNIEVKLDRNGKEILIKTTLTQGYTTGKVLKPMSNATAKQNALREAWLKG